MNKELKKQGYGLLPSKSDDRDFSYQKIFGAVKLEELPLIDFMIAEPISIEDQGDTDYCTAFGSSSISEDQEEIDLDPLYTFAKTKQIIGDWQSWGADLRSTMKAAVKFGFLEKKDVIFTINDEREKIANWENWPVELDEKATLHKKKSYFKIDGPYDIFDNIRSALWQNKEKKQSVFVGCIWRSDWLIAQNGIIPNFPSTSLFGHAFKIAGQKIIQGELYLIAVLSNGKEVGDNGLFYFSREVVNRDFTYGAYCFVDEDPEKAKKVVWHPVRRFWEELKKKINKIIK